MTPEQILVVAHLERLFLGSKDLLWVGCVFHGEYQIFSRSKRGHAVFMSDAADRLMELWKVGIIEPLWFRPSHSRCGFLGLTSHGVNSYGINGNDKDKPNCEVAADWTWEVKVDCTKWTKEMSDELG